MNDIINCFNITSRMTRPDFFEPKLVLENIHIKFEELKPIRRKPILRRRCGFIEPPVSILGKRKLEVAFGFGMNDKERYGQEIPSNFFKSNCGHNVFSYSMEGFTLRHSPVNIEKFYEDRLKYWREKYIVKR